MSAACRRFCVCFSHAWSTLRRRLFSRFCSNSGAQYNEPSIKFSISKIIDSVKNLCPTDLLGGAGLVVVVLERLLGNRTLLLPSLHRICNPIIGQLHHPIAINEARPRRQRAVVTDRRHVQILQSLKNLTDQNSKSLIWNQAHIRYVPNERAVKFGVQRKIVTVNNVLKCNHLLYRKHYSPKFQTK